MHWTGDLFIKIYIFDSYKLVFFIYCLGNYCLQRLQTCQAYANKVGLYQYLETPQTPKCPKKYTLPGGFLFFKNFSCILLRFFLIIATENCVFEGKAESFGVR